MADEKTVLKGSPVDSPLSSNKEASESVQIYTRIRDRGGLGWLHLPTQEEFDRMQDRRRKNAKKH